MKRQPVLSVGALAKATGTKAETIRWYEQIGLLLKPARTAGNYRSYGAADVSRLSFIRRSRDLGFTIEEIRALLSLADQRDRDCDEVDRIARTHLAAIEQKIADLTAMSGELRTVIGQCRGRRIAECRIIEALAPATKASQGVGIHRR